jgi:hypothetical protein
VLLLMCGVEWLGRLFYLLWEGLDWKRCLSSGMADMYGSLVYGTVGEWMGWDVCIIEY